MALLNAANIFLSGIVDWGAAYRWRWRWNIGFGILSFLTYIAGLIYLYKKNEQDQDTKVKAIEANKELGNKYIDYLDRANQRKHESMDKLIDSDKPVESTINFEEGSGQNEIPGFLNSIVESNKAVISQTPAQKSSDGFNEMFKTSMGSLTAGKNKEKKEKN